MAGTRARYVRPRATEPCEIQIVVQIPDVREHAHAKCQMMVHGHGGVTCIQTTEENGTGVGVIGTLNRYFCTFLFLFSVCALAGSFLQEKELRR